MSLINSPGTFAQMKKSDQRIVSTARAEVQRQIISAERTGPISPARKLEIVRGVLAGMAPDGAQPEAIPDATAPINQNIASWSAFIGMQGGAPSLAKINRLNQVARRMPPPAYTDADRQAEMIRIAREP